MAGKPPAWETAQQAERKGGVVRSVSGRRRDRSTADPVGLLSQGEDIILYIKRDKEMNVLKAGG